MSPRFWSSNCPTEPCRATVCRCSLTSHRLHPPGSGSAAAGAWARADAERWFVTAILERRYQIRRELLHIWRRTNLSRLSVMKGDVPVNPVGIRLLRAMGQASRTSPFPCHHQQSATVRIHATCPPAVGCSLISGVNQGDQRVVSYPADGPAFSTGYIPSFWIPNL